MGQVEEDTSIIIRSPHRTRVVERLAKGPAIPAQIRDDTGQEYSRISEAISALRDEELVELVVDEDTKRGRLYKLTERGRDAYEFLEENNML